MALKISISGVRGLVPKSLTPEICLDFAKAFGTYLSELFSDPPTVVVGTDPRASSEFIKGIVFSGLLSAGCKVIDLGICPTPTVGIMVRELKASGGIIITASHNPLPWNGIKFVRNDGIFLNEGQMKKFLRIYQDKAFIKKEPLTVESNPSAIDTHIRKLLKVVNVAAIRKRKFRVALDCANGAGSVICLKLLQKLGCRVEAISCDPSKPFPRHPEPVAENLGQLMALIKRKKVDIGFALDSDADRLAVVSPDGRPIGEEVTLALAVKAVLSRQPLKPAAKRIVITNLSTTQAIDDIVREYNGTVIRTKIGEVHVADQIKHLKALIGGEGNGGVIYPPVGFNRDGQTAMALILNFMAITRQSLPSLVAEVPAYYILKKKIKCRSQDEADAVVEKVKEDFKGKDLILTDGVKVLLPGSWVHVRASNTEPVIRIIAEGSDKNEVRNLVKKVLKPLR